MRILSLRSSLLAAFAFALGCAHAPPSIDVGVVLRDLDGQDVRPCTVPEAARANVLVFLTTDCPIANAYAPEIRRIVEEHREDMRFFLVHVDPDLTPAKARQHASEYGIDVAPILFDRRHEAARVLGVTVTPEAAVLLEDGTLFYRGRIDDLFADLGKKRRRARKRDLRGALSALREGARAPRPFTTAVGCDLPMLDG